MAESSTIVPVSDGAKEELTGESPSNHDIVSRAQRALSERIEWERKLARMQLQRFCADRNKVNNSPWPRASNVRYPLSDTIIDQKKPFLYKLTYSSQNIAFFKAMVPSNVKYTDSAAAYLDFVLKEKTEFESEIQLCGDSRYQDGETVMKTGWDFQKQVPTVEHIDNLFIITPSNTGDLSSAPWIIHVRQMSVKQFVGAFKKYTKEGQTEEERAKELRKKAVSIRDNEQPQNDQGNRESDEYMREGINRTVLGGKIVVWECHYEDDTEKKFIRSILPDDEDFDLLDDREYPFDHGEWCFLHDKREITNRKMHASRGIPELVADGEASLTSMWRAKQNAMSLCLVPVYEGNIPGSTQNITMGPGTLLPPGVKMSSSGSYPFEQWDGEMANTRGIWERRAGAPDFGLGRANTLGEKRTAKEIQSIDNQQLMGVELEAGNWKRFIRAICGQCWAMIVQFKPQSLIYYLGKEMSELQPDALNNDFIITVSASAEAINKEWMVQKAQALWQAAQNNPYANGFEAWKNLVQNMNPGEVSRFAVDPQQHQQEAAMKTASDIAIMSIGFPVPPMPTDNHGIACMTAMQWLQAKQKKNERVDPQLMRLVGQYIAGHREALKHQDKQAYAQLNQALNQIDMQNQQAQQPQRMAA